MQYQVQEILRTERIFEAAEIEAELDAYNPLIPDGSNWKATFMIEFDDEEATINTIRRKLDGEAAARLIRVSEKVVRGALRELSARDLMRIGALAVEADDEPIAIPADGEIDKLVAALLDGGEPAEQEAA